MEFPYIDNLEVGGFNFDNSIRNEAIVKQCGKEPTATSTGTTIVGCAFKNGIIMAADTRATAGPIVGDKNCFKLHYLAPNIWAAGCGTAADCDHVTEMIKRDLQLHRLNTGSDTRVMTAVTKFSSHLFNYMGHIGAGIILGGIDVKGPQVWSIDPHGHTMALPFHTQGSGSVAAMAVLENDYREENGELVMEEQETIDLWTRAIEAGIYHDLGSGSNVDYVVITKDGYKYKRSHKSDNHKMFTHPTGYNFPTGTTEVLDVTKIPLDIQDGQAPMDL
jgi:20S proteasome subunit beta 2